VLAFEPKARATSDPGGTVTLSIRSADEVWLRAPIDQLQSKQEGIATLILDRNWEFQIGESIHIEVVDIRYDKVRLGISAPHDVPVLREEVYEAIKRANGGLEALLPDASAGQPAPRLSLWRTRGEGIVVGQDVSILVLDVMDGEVRLSIRTPNQAVVDIPEHRRWNLAETIKALLPARARHCIARDIFVNVQTVESNRVQLAIEAPEDLPVLRKETWDRLHGG